jgi:hypothetical protein
MPAPVPHLPAPGLALGSGSGTPSRSRLIAAPEWQAGPRTVVSAGVLTTALGAGWLWLTVYSNGIALGTWDLVGPMVVTGLGMGLTFGTLFDIAVGDASPDEAGSAGGSLSAVQHLAGAIGAAAISSTWLAYGTDMAQSMQACVIVVGIVCLAVLATIPPASPQGSQRRPRRVARRSPTDENRSPQPETQRLRCSEPTMTPPTRRRFSNAVQEVFQTRSRLPGVQRWACFWAIRQAHLLQVQQHGPGLFGARRLLEVMSRSCRVSRRGAWA